MTTPQAGTVLPLADPRFYAGDPYPTLARLRDEKALHWHDEGRFWAVVRHQEIVEISRDPATFCSGRGILLEDRRRTAQAESIIFLDPPLHQKQRNLVSGAFHVRRVAALEDRVRQLATRLLDDLPDDGPVDWVDAVAAPLPLLVIAELLGIPQADLDRFRRWSDALIDEASAPSPGNAQAAVELYEYFGEVIARRRTDPGDDLVSLLVQSEVDGERLSKPELLGFCMTLLVAGNETTRTLMSGSVLALAEHPGEWERLRGELALVPSAVEELLRWVTPIMAFARTATRDVEVAGEQLREGDYLFMLYLSGNRDEEAFGPTAGRLDLARKPNPHLAFGFGEHFCLGAGLARLEARVVLDELARRYRSIELAGDVERLPSTLVRGILRLPVELRLA